MANFLSDLQKKYSDILNPINQGLSSYAHGVQQRFNTPSKIAPPPAQNNSIRSFINPIVNEAKNIVTQQIPSFQRFVPLTQPFQNPVGFLDAVKQQTQNFQKNGLNKGAQNVGMDAFNSAKLGANVLGGSKMLAGGPLNAVKTILPNAVIGGGFNKLTGGSFSEGAGKGVAISPSIRGITGITNPLIEKYTQLLAPRIAPQLTNSAVGNYLTTSTLRGLQNIPEGAVIDATLGNRPMGTTSMMLDFASGFIPGSPNIRNQSSVYNVDVVKPWQKAFRAASDQAVAERINIAIKNLDDEFQSATNVIPKKYVDVINEASSFFLPKEAQKLPLKEKMDVWRYIFARSAGMYTDKVPEVLRGVDEMYNPKTLLNNSMGIVDKKNVAQQGGEINALKQELSGHLNDLSKEELYMKPIAMDIAFAKRDGVPVQKFLNRKITNKLDEIGFLLEEDTSLAKDINKLPKAHRDEAIRYLESNFNFLKGKFDNKTPLVVKPDWYTENSLRRIVTKNNNPPDSLNNLSEKELVSLYEDLTGALKKDSMGSKLQLGGSGRVRKTLEDKNFADGGQLQKEAFKELNNIKDRFYVDDSKLPLFAEDLRKRVEPILEKKMNGSSTFSSSHVAQQGGETAGKKVYHAGTHDEFKIPTQTNGLGQAKAVYFSETADGTKYYQRGARTVQEATIKPEAKIWDYRKPEDIKILDDYVDKTVLNNPQWNQSFKNLIRTGDWGTIEKPEVQAQLKKLGFDGFVNKDMTGHDAIGITNLKMVSNPHVAQPPIDDIGKVIPGNSFAQLKGIDPESTITVYRGVKSSYNKPLSGGEWVTQDKQLANLYARNRARAGGESAKIISQKVKAKDLIIDPATSPGVENEFRYNPKSSQPPLYDISKEPRVQGQMKGLSDKGKQMTIEAEGSRRPVINEPNLDYVLKRAGASPEEIASGKITVYRATENGKILPGDFVSPNKDVLKPYFDQRVETGRSPKIVSQKVDIKDLVIGDEPTDFVYRPSQPPVTDIAQKSFTQPGSATNTRADQVATKYRKPAPFEVEMDAQVGKPYEKPFTGKSKVKYKEPTQVPGDQATTDFATARASMGGNGVKGLPKETSDQYQKWVNTRRATDIEGFLKKKEFSDLNNKGIEGIFEFQSGNKTGRYGDVKQYFDTKYKTLQGNKIEFDFRQDYLPQLWNNTPEEINQVMGRRMGMKPSFTLDAVFKSYKEGIEAGLTPKFQNISDLVGWYEQKANKAIADKNFFDYLGKDGTILPSTKAPQEWVTLDPDRFPKFLTQIGDEKFSGTYKAPKEVADVINNYLQGARIPMLEKVANYVSKVKNITLNFGIPGTGINMHGVNILARHTLMGTGGNPISRFITGGKFMLAPNLAAKELDKSMVNAPQAVKNGLSLSAEDYSGLTRQGEGFRAQFGRKWEAMFGDPLFNKMIPALKLSSYENLVKNGMNEKDAAKLINNVYGGINWEQMGRSKDMQNLIRIAILAPDWAESTLKIGGNFAKALNPLEKSATVGRYRTMMATVFASYIAHNIVNKITSGHYSYENDPSNIFNIEIGYTDSGEKRYFRPYGTGLDMVRLPAEVAMGLYKGDLTGITRLLRNRLSIPAGVGLGLLTDQDYRGNAIGYRGTDKYGNEMPLSQRAGNITSEMASLVGVPAFTRQLYRGVSGQQGLEESLTQGLELPFRYSNTGNSNVQKQVDFIADEQGLKGKDRYDFNQQLKGQSKFSDNQLNVIKSYDNKSQGLKDTLQLRKVRSEVEKAKKGALKESGIDQADAAEETPITTNSNMQLEIAKSRVKMTKKTERVGDNIVYPTETGSSTLSLTPPTKGSGIGAYANKDWNITKAREVWNNDQLSKEDKDYAFKKLNVKAEDVRYDALANYSNDIKSQYLSSKSDTKEKLINNILTGRKRSIGDNIFASDGVIDSLVDEGKLTKEEGKALKAIDYNKDGSRKIKVGSGRGKKIKIPKVKAITIKFNKSKRIKVKQIKPKKVKQYKLSKVTKVKKLKV